MIHESIANEIGGKVLKIDWCTQKDVWGNYNTLPSCEGHSVISVSKITPEIQKRVNEINESWNNWGSIWLTEPDQ